MILLFSVCLFSSFYLVTFDNVKQYKLKDFEIYALGTCESYDSSVGRSKRFNNCPDNFFEISKEKKLVKVEEVYLLIHNESNLVLYFTTKTKRNLKRQKGFLNDRKIYENSIILSDIEFIYVGINKPDSNLIEFKKLNKNLLITWQYSIEDASTIYIKEGTIPVRENKMKPNIPINLEDIHANGLKFRKSSYDLYSRNKSDKILDFEIKESSGSIEILFNSLSNNKKWKKRLKYKPTFKELN